MSTVHICLSDIFGVAVACEVIFYPGDTPFINGSALAVSGARSIRLDAGGNGSVALLPGRYIVRFSGITGNTDTLHILVPNEESDYQLAELMTGDSPQDFLQKSKDLSDVANPAAAFEAIKQPATTATAGAIQLALQAEVDAGTDATKAVTPATLVNLAKWATAGQKVRFMTAADVTARFALTQAQASTGDLVEQADTRAVYEVLDAALLNQENGYILIGTRSAVYTSLNNGLLAYWNLDEETGVRVDATGNGHDLSDTNAVGYTVGKFGNAAQFDGTNYLSSVDVFDTSSNFSVCCWVKPAAFTGYQDAIELGSRSVWPMQIMAWASGYNSPLLVSGAAGLILSLAYVGGTDVAHFLAATYDAATATFTFHVDGQSTSSVATEEQLATIPAAGPLTIGGSTASLTGSVDSVGLWNRALSSEEIAQLYNNGNGLAYPFA